ncbi:MAG: phosphonate C-P lyase system protein PhnH [Aminipila sp.]
MKRIHDFDIVHDGQQMFRLILSAMSNPLQRKNIRTYAEKLYGNNKSFLAIAFTLIDNETTFFTFENQILDDNIISLTLSSKECCENADYIFVENAANLKTAISTAKCGMLEDPQKSATIIVKIKNEEKTTLTMIGAGIDGSISIETDSLVEKAIDLRDKMCFEYPTGLDFIFVDENCQLMAIPRLVKKGGK